MGVFVARRNGRRVLGASVTEMHAANWDQPYD
jgi:hypothetical protein